MEKILCYGDSNTWGYIPGTGNRYSNEERWTGILQSKLGEQYQVLEEGLNGRTTLEPDPERDLKSGLDDVPKILAQYSDITIAIVMLGTNDLKARYRMMPETVARGAVAVASAIAASPALTPDARLIVVAPPVIDRLPAEYAEEFYGAEAKSREFARRYQAELASPNMSFLDASISVTSSSIDGFHWDANEHQNFAEALHKVINPSN